MLKKGLREEREGGGGERERERETERQSDGRCKMRACERVRRIRRG